MAWDAVIEGQGVATIAVTRTGGAGGTVTVPFATADGTAAAGADYGRVAVSESCLAGTR